MKEVGDVQFHGTAKTNQDSCRQRASGLELTRSVR